MKALQGKGVSPGSALGALQFYRPSVTTVEKRTVADTDGEIRRFESARALAAAQLGELSVVMGEKLGKQNSLLFEIHQMMLEDTDFLELVFEQINENHSCAEYAVQQAAEQLGGMLAAMEDEYMRERAADVKDVSRRVIAILAGQEYGGALLAGPCILAGDDFAPSETASFEPGQVLALLTSGGSANSHTSIFARTMGIPAVVGLGNALKTLAGQTTVIVDGSTGDVIADPNAEALARYKAKREKQTEEHRLLLAFQGLENKSLDGVEIELCANIGSVEDAVLALQNDAGGVGLFRSEFLYLQAKDYPTEETQFEGYKAVAAAMEGRRVVIRTLDIGADKQASYFGIEAEENPALGYRAIRICLDRPDIFKTQLRAIYRASAFGKIAIMLPMITSVWEVREAKKLAVQVREELCAEGIAFDEAAQLGIMIETPAAALSADLLAQEVDFFSVGTNDLTQYTLALDRQNDKLDRYYNPHHIAIKRMLKLAADSIHQTGGWLGICGELAADTEMTATFLALGVDELSVTPSRILPVRHAIRQTDVGRVKKALLDELKGLW